VGPAGPAGAGAALALTCANFGPVAPGSAISLINNTVNDGISFGTTIGANQLGQSIVLQPGVYLVHLDAPYVLWSLPDFLSGLQALPQLDIHVFNPSGDSAFSYFGQVFQTPPNQGSTIMGGDRLVRVTGPNTTARFIVGGSLPLTFDGGCTVVIIQLQ